ADGEGERMARTQAVPGVAGPDRAVEARREIAPRADDPPRASPDLVGVVDLLPFRRLPPEVLITVLGVEHRLAEPAISAQAGDELRVVALPALEGFVPGHALATLPGFLRDHVHARPPAPKPAPSPR